MRRNKGGILIVAAVFVLLVLMNLFLASEPDPSDENEQTGSRSSYRSSPYGTLALYTLLEESGYNVTRLEAPYTVLADRSEIKTLVIIGLPMLSNPSEEEIGSLAKWVEAGGTVVIIDRVIQLKIGGMGVSTGWGRSLANVRPLQPTALTRGVQRVAISRYASTLSVESPSATYHLGNEDSVVLADAGVGVGRVLMLTDPFVVANNGISQDDNAVLALNLFSDSRGGTIAFDEYHHGYREGSSGGLTSYLRGTPLPWMMAQAGLVGALLVYTYGRRFGRPIPLRRERRTTNLEFISSMANITRLARATDLAMQNIFYEFRKRLCRYEGLPAAVRAEVLVSAVASRAKLDSRELGRLLERCAAIAQGHMASDAELLRLVSRIREIESELKL